MKSSRPLPITILCVVGFIGAFFGMFLVVSPVVQQVGRVYAVYLSLSLTIRVILLGNLWMMRKWVVWAFSIYFVIDQLVCRFYGIWNSTTLFPLVIISAALFYYRRLK